MKKAGVDQKTLKTIWFFSVLILLIISFMLLLVGIIELNKDVFLVGLILFALDCFITIIYPEYIIHFKS